MVASDGHLADILFRFNEEVGYDPATFFPSINPADESLSKVASTISAFVEGGGHFTAGRNRRPFFHVHS